MYYELINYKIKLFRGTKESTSMKLKLIIVQATENVLIDYTDNSPYVITHISISGPQQYSTVQIRNLRDPLQQSEKCVNNVGSYVCVPNNQERVAIGLI